MNRYKQYEDGVWRLQTVRFESLQLSQQFDKGEEEEEEQAVQEEPSTEDDESSQDSLCENHHNYENTDSESGLYHHSQNTLNNQSNESSQSNCSQTMEVSSYYNTVNSTHNTTYINTESLSRSGLFHTIDGPAVASLGGSYLTEIPQTQDNTVVEHNARYDRTTENCVHIAPDEQMNEQTSFHQFDLTRKKKRRMNTYEKP